MALKSDVIVRFPFLLPRPDPSKLRRLLESGLQQQNCAKALWRPSVLLGLHKQHHSRDSDMPCIGGSEVLRTHACGHLDQHNRFPPRHSFEPRAGMGQESVTKGSYDSMEHSSRKFHSCHVPKQRQDINQLEISGSTARVQRRKPAQGSLRDSRTGKWNAS